jgi:hypothetical protein
MEALDLPFPTHVWFDPGRCHEHTDFWDVHQPRHMENLLHGMQVGAQTPMHHEYCDGVCLHKTRGNAAHKPPESVSFSKSVVAKTEREWESDKEKGRGGRKDVNIRYRSRRSG